MNRLSSLLATLLRNLEDNRAQQNFVENLATEYLRIYTSLDGDNFTGPEGSTTHHRCLRGQCLRLHFSSVPGEGGIKPQNLNRLLDKPGPIL